MSVKHSVLQFKFENFEGLSTIRNKEVVSNIVTDCDGDDWKLIMYPGGEVRNDYESDDGMMALFLSSYAEKYKHMELVFEAILRNSAGGVHDTRAFMPGKFDHAGCMRGTENFIKRSEVLDKSNKILFEGSLHIDVHLQYIIGDTIGIVPSSSLAKNMLRLLENENNADVSFKIGEEVITAHKNILETNAPTLYEFCEKGTKDEPIPMTAASPECFRTLLRYIYAEEVPDIDSFENNNKEKHIIDVSDRYGIVGLKLGMERALVESLPIHYENAVELLVFAESNTCALLKEYAMVYIAARPNDILSSEYAKELKETPELLTELISEISNRDTRFVSAEKKMSVAELRNILEEKGLDTDGSKEMMVSRLENANKRQRTE